MEIPGFEPGTFHMQSERSTAEPYPRTEETAIKMEEYAPGNKDVRFWRLKSILALKSEYIYKGRAPVT